MKSLITLLILLFSIPACAQDVTPEAFTFSVANVNGAKVENWITVKDGLMTYDKEGKRLTGTINKSAPGLSWRLVHDGKKVITKFECSGVTSTVYALFVAKTEKELQDEITKLGLIDLVEEEL